MAERPLTPRGAGEGEELLAQLRLKHEEHELDCCGDKKKERKEEERKAEQERVGSGLSFGPQSVQTTSSGSIRLVLFDKQTNETGLKVTSGSPGSAPGSPNLDSVSLTVNLNMETMEQLVGGEDHQSIS